jgi:hypothetical protein
MIGSPDLSVTGYEDGTAVKIMENGEFTGEFAD